MGAHTDVMTVGAGRETTVTVDDREGSRAGCVRERGAFGRPQSWDVRVQPGGTVAVDPT
jgi:hypothetical protein